MPAPALKRNTRSRPAEAETVSNPEPYLTDAPVVSETPDAPRLETEEIARLAYSYWESRGCTGGSAEEDWLRAEQELRVRA
jgi:hypothetical protein